MPDTILCLFSGGLDSTGVLYRLLTDEQYAKYDIQVHHINLVNVEQRHIAEARAVAECIHWFNNNCEKSFKYTANTIEYTWLKSVPLDAEVSNFMAGIIINNTRENYKYIAFGKTKNDSNRSITSLSDDLLEATIKKETDVKKVYPVEDMTKGEIYHYLPEELRKLTWSCRKPKYEKGNPIACTRCTPCKDIAEIEK